jgi:hypothetical protein
MMRIRRKKTRMMRTRLVEMEQMMMELLVTLVRALLAPGATAAVIVSADVSATAGIISICAIIAGSQQRAECSHVHS